MSTVVDPGATGGGAGAWILRNNQSESSSSGITYVSIPVRMLQNTHHHLYSRGRCDGGKSRPRYSAHLIQRPIGQRLRIA